MAQWRLQCLLNDSNQEPNRDVFIQLVLTEYAALTLWKSTLKLPATSHIQGNISISCMSDLRYRWDEGLQGSKVRSRLWTTEGRTRVCWSLLSNGGFGWIWCTPDLFESCLTVFPYQDMICFTFLLQWLIQTYSLDWTCPDLVAWPVLICTSIGRPFWLSCSSCWNLWILITYNMNVNYSNI